MKKRIKNVVFIVAMLASVMSYASADYALNTKKISTILTLTNVKKGQKLVIKDADLSIIYKELIANDGIFSKGYDLTALPDGKYFFELEKDVEIVIMPFTVVSNEVKFEKEKEAFIYKPTVRTVDNIVYVSRLSLDTQPLKIKIYYRESFGDTTTLVFSEEIKNTKIIERIYELSKLKKGDYTIVFKTQNREFTERIKF
ncbi:hypothetical protein IMCC3317_26980 [Kordia antarctica]|uniref:Uncharacterized protein n=1 Tax=Kordia antarctica TaxID=1218801 RepID=A0A7L4ZLK4_9FLAO|nr:hypothetical protein [Kordia antarctica]QHI37319.1 hypothetical protein IMCC3317_26980 [Kordia antarctica]